MLTGMLILMVPFGHVVHGHHLTEAIGLALPSYLSGWIAAMAVRLAIGDPIVSLAASRFVCRLKSEWAAALSMALINILVMSTIMSLVGLLMGGVSNVVDLWLSSLPAIWLFAFCANFFVVGPLATWLTVRVARPLLSQRARA